MESLMFDVVLYINFTNIQEVLNDRTNSIGTDIESQSIATLRYV